MRVRYISAAVEAEAEAEAEASCDAMRGNVCGLSSGLEGTLSVEWSELDFSVEKMRELPLMQKGVSELTIRAQGSW